MGVWVRGQRVYSTEKADLIFVGPADSGLPDVEWIRRLYRTARGQLFMTIADLGPGTPPEGTNERFDLIEDEHIPSVVEWLEKNDAPVSIYEAVGIPLEEG